MLFPINTDTINTFIEHRVARFSQQDPPNCYSKLAQWCFEGWPLVKITFRGVKYSFFWCGSPYKIHIPGAKYHVIWVTSTHGNSVKVTQFRGKTADFAALLELHIGVFFSRTLKTVAMAAEDSALPSQESILLSRTVILICNIIYKYCCLCCIYQINLALVSIRKKTFEMYPTFSYII